jgi:hypothetical protein
VSDKPQIPNFNVPHIQLREGVIVTKHKAVFKAYELCLAIEELPASIGETNTVTLAGKLKDLIWCLCEGIIVNEDGSTEQKSPCRFIPNQSDHKNSRCGNKAEWRIVHGETGGYTESCAEHIGQMLTDAKEHKIYPIK